MITTDAFIRHVHALLAFAGRVGYCAVGVEDGFIGKLLRRLFPKEFHEWEIMGAPL
jgi:hypothetical protein